MTAGVVHRELTSVWYDNNVRRKITLPARTSVDQKFNVADSSNTSSLSAVLYRVPCSYRHDHKYGCPFNFCMALYN